MNGLNSVAGAVGAGGFFEDAGEFAGEVGLVGEAAVVADFGEGLGGANDEVGFGEFGDGDVFAVALVEELEGGTEFVVLGEGGDTLVEGASDADDAAGFSVLVEEGFLCGGGPVDKAAASGNEFDVVDDGVSGFEDAEVVAFDGFEDVSGDEVVVALAEDGGGFKDFAEALVVRDVSEIEVFYEVDEKSEL